MILVLACAVGVGLVLSLLGAGGSILTVPILTLVADLEPRSAILASLVVVGTTSFFSAIMHGRTRRLRLEVALLFASTSVPAAYLGAQLSRGLSPRTLTLCFAGLMVFSALTMVVRRERVVEEEPRSRLAMLAVGAVVGFVTGVLGAGGGFVIVPAFVLFGGLSMRDAVPSALVVITLNCVAGLAGKWGSAPVPWGLTATFAGIALCGTALGLRVGNKVSASALRRLFAGLVVAVALVMAFNP